MVAGSLINLSLPIISQGWRKELKPGGAIFEFPFTKLSRRRFAPPRSHLPRSAFWAGNYSEKLTIPLTSSSTGSATLIVQN